MKPKTTHVEIPCKEKKCILYPTCINKIEINCGFLFDFYFKNSEHESAQQIWRRIDKIFPKLKEIRGPVKTGFIHDNESIMYEHITNKPPKKHSAGTKPVPNTTIRITHEKYSM